MSDFDLEVEQELDILWEKYTKSNETALGFKHTKVAKNALKVLYKALGFTSGADFTVVLRRAIKARIAYLKDMDNEIDSLKKELGIDQSSSMEKVTIWFAVIDDENGYLKSAYFLTEQRAYEYAEAFAFHGVPPLIKSIETYAGSEAHSRAVENCCDLPEADKWLNGQEEKVMKDICTYEDAKFFATVYSISDAELFEMDEDE